MIMIVIFILAVVMIKLTSFEHYSTSDSVCALSHQMLTAFEMGAVILSYLTKDAIET